MAEPIDFNGWVHTAEYAPGLLQVSDIRSLPTLAPDHCESKGSDGRTCTGMQYELVNPEEATVLCQVHLESLYAHRCDTFVMGRPS